MTWLVALGSNLSALWILIANGWMQHPVGARFNPDTMRMEVTDFMAVLFNPVAQDKFVHTVCAGYVTGSMFVLAISAYYLLRGRHVEFAKRSMAVAASFGLAAALSVVVLGDESGYTAGAQPEDEDRRDRGDVGNGNGARVLHPVRRARSRRRTRREYALRVPWVLGLIATRSLHSQVAGHHSACRTTRRSASLRARGL